MPGAEVYRGGFWLFATQLANSGFGLVYWLLMSRLVGAEALGYAGAVASLAALAVGVASFGVPTGLLRQVGEAYGRGDVKRASAYTWTAVVYFTVAYSIAAAVASFFVPPQLRFAVVVAILVGVFAAFDVYVAALFRTEVKFLGALLGGVAKIVVGVALAGWGWVGAVAGYVVGNAVSLALVSVFAVRRLVWVGPAFGLFVEMARAGVSVWAPNALATLAQQSGVLAVFVAVGAVQTGLLYVAQAVAGLISAVAGVAVGLLVPALAAMEGGRGVAASSAARVALALAAPPAAFLVVAPYVPLGLLGGEYVAASGVLSLLVLAALAGVVAGSAVSYLVAEGRYRSALVLQSLYTSVQLVLYVFLIPLFGVLGVGLAALAASVVAAVVGGRFVAVGWRHLAAAVLPFVVVAPAGLLGWAAALLAAVSVYLIYPRVGVLTRSDVSSLAAAVLGRRAYAIYSRYRELIDRFLPPG